MASPGFDSFSSHRCHQPLINCPTKGWVGGEFILMTGLNGFNHSAGTKTADLLSLGGSAVAEQEKLSYVLCNPLQSGRLMLGLLLL